MRISSLPDWAFFPLATLIIGGMVFGALSFGRTATLSVTDLRAGGRVFQGEELGAMALGNGLALELLADDDLVYARLAAERGPLDGIQSAGAFFVLTEVERSAFQGHRVRIRLTARSSGTNGADGMRFNLFIPGRGQNDWDRVTLGGDFDTYDFEIGAAACIWDFGYVALWPDWTLDANMVEISRIELSALEPLSDCA